MLEQRSGTGSISDFKGERMADVSGRGLRQFFRLCLTTRSDGWLVHLGRPAWLSPMWEFREL